MKRATTPPLLLVLLLALAQGADGSIHRVSARLTGVRVTERMFADGRGPWGRASGRSTVAVDAAVRALRDDEVADSITVHRLRDYFELGVAVASFTDGAAELNASSACAANFSSENAPGLLYGEFHALADGEELAIRTVFHPNSSALQQVIIAPCWKQKSEAFGFYPVSAEQFSLYPMADPLLYVDATVTFENPYGYLPALLAGIYQFKYVPIHDDFYGY